MIAWLCPWVIALLATYPVAVTLTRVAGRPIDAVLSDALFLFLLLTPQQRLVRVPATVDLRRFTAVRVVAVVCGVYCVGLSLVGYAATPELLRVIEAVELTKPLCFLVIGSYLAMIFPPPLLLRRIAVVFGGIACCTLASAVFHPEFPNRGFGEFLFGNRLHGYPHSAMSFYGILVPLLLSVADGEPGRWQQRFLYGSALVTMVLVIGSLSSVSVLAMASGLACYVVMMGRIRMTIAASVAGLILVGAGIGFATPEADVGAMQRSPLDLERNAGQSAHRDSALPPDQDASFQPDLPGSVLYVLLIGSALAAVVHQIRMTGPHVASSFLFKAVLSAFVAALISNLMLPNPTYPITGNTMFLMVGLVASRHASAAALQEVGPQFDTPTSVQRPITAVFPAPAMPSASPLAAAREIPPDRSTRIQR